LGGAAEDTASKWLVGIWEGTQRLGVYETSVTVEFKDGGNWELEVTSGPCRGSKARGSATVSGTAVELKGQYYQTYGPCGPSYLAYSLMRADGALEGTGIGAANVTFNVSWKRGK